MAIFVFKRPRVSILELIHSVPIIVNKGINMIRRLNE